MPYEVIETRNGHQVVGSVDGRLAARREYRYGCGPATAAAARVAARYVPDDGEYETHPCSERVALAVRDAEDDPSLTEAQRAARVVTTAADMIEPDRLRAFDRDVLDALAQAGAAVPAGTDAVRGGEVEADDEAGAARAAQRFVAAHGLRPDDVELREGGGRFQRTKRVWEFDARATVGPDAEPMTRRGLQDRVEVLVERFRGLGDTPAGDDEDLNADSERFAVELNSTVSGSPYVDGSGYFATQDEAAERAAGLVDDLRALETAGAWLSRVDGRSRETTPDVYTALISERRDGSGEPYVEDYQNGPSAQGQAEPDQVHRAWDDYAPDRSARFAEPGLG